MNSFKCKGKTRKGKPCKNKAMKNSQYCWIHKPSEKGPPRKNRLITVAKVVVTVLISATIAYYFGIKTEKKIDQIVAPYAEREKDNRQRLLEKYPLGYVFGGYNKKNSTLSPIGQTQPSLEYEVDPKAMEVTVSSGSIRIVFPPMTNKHTQTVIKAPDRSFPLTDKQRQRVDITLPDVEMWFELLDDDQEKLIFIVGFCEENQ